MPLKCKLGLHRFQKFMGPQNSGGGKFTQAYKCALCGKVKYKTC